MTKKPIAFDEQLATRGDLSAAIAAAIAPLATREELQAAIAPLATRSEMLMLHESLRGDIQLLADSLLSLHAKFDAISTA